MYKEDLPHPVMLCTEYNMWVIQWQQQHTDITDITNKLVDTFNLCSELQFPNVHVLLRVALTLPITSCEIKQSFSQLKLIKTSYRSTMTNNRLGGLALMKINRDYCNELSFEEKTKNSEVICTVTSKENEATFYAVGLRVITILRGACHLYSNTCTFILL